MFPMIDGPKMARKAVSYCRFPPNGVRGSAHTVVRASGYGIDAGYLSNYEDELLIMCQVLQLFKFKNLLFNCFIEEIFYGTFFLCENALF